MPTDDPLDALRERIRATQEAAEQLASEAAARERRGGTGAERGDQEETVREAQALVAVLQTLRDMVPPELWQQIRDLIRQLLLLIRAIIDWWVDRLNSSSPTARGAAPEVEDIEIS